MLVSLINTKSFSSQHRVSPKLSCLWISESHCLTAPQWENLNSLYAATGYLTINLILPPMLHCPAFSLFTLSYKFFMLFKKSTDRDYNLYLGKTSFPSPAWLPPKPQLNISYTITRFQGLASPLSFPHSSSEHKIILTEFLQYLHSLLLKFIWQPTAYCSLSQCQTSAQGPLVLCENFSITVYVIIW